MLQLNDQFLEEVGLADLPEEKREPFLRYVYETLETRTGEVLSAGMTNEQLDEFEGLIDRVPPKVIAWLERYAPDFLEDPLYTAVREGLGEAAPDVAVLGEYACTKWLAVNRPDYREQVMKVIDGIKEEIKANRDAILGSG